MTTINITMIILLLVFSTVYIGFNFEYVKSGLADISDGFLPSNNSVEEDLFGITFSYPISNEFVGSRKIAPTPVPIPNTIGYMPAKSVYNLSIPTLGIEAPIVLEKTTNVDKIYKRLEEGTVHYASTPLPGEFGTSIILGHSSAYPWYRGNYGNIFASLSKLESGDLVNIEREGQAYTYKVSRSIIFSPDSDNDYELRELEYTNGKSIVLMTCWPTGTNTKRIAVRADLI